MGNVVAKTWEPLAAKATIGPLDPEFRPILNRAMSQQHREMAELYGAPDGPLVHSYYPGGSLKWA